MKGAAGNDVVAGEEVSQFLISKSYQEIIFQVAHCSPVALGVVRHANALWPKSIGRAFKQMYSSCVHPVPSVS